MPVSLQTVKPATDRANPRVGVGALAFSSDNYFLATRNGQCSSPTSLSTPFPPVPATQTAPACGVPHLSAEPALLPTEASRARGFVSHSAQCPLLSVHSFLFGKDQDPGPTTAVTSSYKKGFYIFKGFKKAPKHAHVAEKPEGSMGPSTDLGALRSSPGSSAPQSCLSDRRQVSVSELGAGG